MSKELSSQPQPSEEVDLGQLFKLIGGAFDRLFNFIGRIFSAVFSIVVYAIKAIIDNIKLIAIVLLLAAVLGYALEKTQPDMYKSQMLVKPYFESKYQLITNINYYNALIQERDYSQLKEIFDIDIQEANTIVQFEILSGPESENDQIQQYDVFLKSIDSTRAQEISFTDFIENRNIYSGEVFEISVISEQKDIFRSLESGLNKTFTNTYSSKKMQKRDSIIALSKARIESSLKQVDSLKNVYIKVLQDDVNSKNQGPLTVKEGMSLVQERVKTKEFELLEKELKLKEELSVLETKKVEEDVFFDTISSFQDVGAKYKKVSQQYSLIFPALSFVFLILSFFLIKVIRFAKNYEG